MIYYVNVKKKKEHELHRSIHYTNEHKLYSTQNFKIKHKYMVT